MFKGVVMKVEDKHIVLMRSTGQIDRIERGSRVCEAGQEIVYAARTKAPVKGLLISVIGLTAVLAVCFFFVVRMLGVSSSSDEVIAYVSMDMNPSIEMGIDENETVRELRGLNSDGEKLAKSIAYEDKSLEEVVASILDKEEQGSLKEREGDIVIASATIGDRAKLSDVVLSAKLKKQVTDHLQQTHPSNASSFIVASFPAPYELKAAAEKANLSMGKYAIYLKMKSLGSTLTTSQFAAKPIYALAKENKQLKSELSSTQSFTKTALLALLKEEQNGTLGKKNADDGLPTVTPKPVTSPSQAPKPTVTPKPTPSPTPTGSQTPKPGGTTGGSATPKQSGSPTGSPKTSATPTVSPKPGGTSSPTSSPSASAKPTTSPAH